MPDISNLNNRKAASVRTCAADIDVPGPEIGVGCGARPPAGALHLQVDDHVHGLANKITAVYGFPFAVYIIMDVHVRIVHPGDPYTVIMPAAGRTIRG